MTRSTSKKYSKATPSVKRCSKQTLRRLLTKQQLQNLSPAARIVAINIATQARAMLKNHTPTPEGRERLAQLLGGV